MSKYDILEDDKAKKIIRDAELVENDKKKDNDKIRISLVNFPKKYQVAIKNSDESVNSYIRRAVKKMLREDGLI